MEGGFRLMVANFFEAGRERRSTPAPLGQLLSRKPQERQPAARWTVSDFTHPTQDRH